MSAYSEGKVRKGTTPCSQTTVLRAFGIDSLILILSILLLLLLLF